MVADSLEEIEKEEVSVVGMKAVMEAEGDIMMVPEEEEATTSREEIEVEEEELVAIETIIRPSD